MDIAAIRQDFPILSRQVNGRPLVYLDNAASSQKPRQVVDAMSNYLLYEHSNVHRGVHTLSQEATVRYEQARATVAKFIGASKSEEVIFTRGTTESMNLLAWSYADAFLTQGQAILISEMEHHANIVPWQLLLKRRPDLRLLVCRIHDNGTLDLEDFHAKLADQVGLVSLTWTSNALGTINPVNELVEAAHNAGAKIALDAAQAVPHFNLEVAKVGADFVVFSGHKMCGPTGIGILYGKLDLLEQMPPFMGGGDMIKEVSFSGTTFNEVPLRFEAGTPSIAEAIGLGAACDYLTNIGMDQIAAREQHLLQVANQAISEVKNLKIYGEAPDKAAVISFLIGSIHPYDMGTILDQYGIAIRTGHHCTQPLMERFQIPGTCRASFSFYNTEEEIALFADALVKTSTMLSR